MANQFALEKAKARTKEIEARKDLDRPRRDVDLGDIGKSALTGARSGLESTVGGAGDIGGLQKQATSYTLDKLGLSPEASSFIAKYTNPLSLFPSTEDIGEATDQIFGRDDYTRHEATTPQGQNFQTASEFGSGLIGGPENFGKDVALKLGMASVPALKAGRKAMSGLTDEAVDFFKDFTRAVPEPEPGYVYHTSPRDRALDIREEGSINTYDPSHGTDQEAWPDASVDPRSYWGPSPKHTVPFSQENPTLWRTKQDQRFKNERGTGDLYATEPVTGLEYYGEGGGWHGAGPTPPPAKAPAAPVTRDDIAKVAKPKVPAEEVIAPHASGDTKTNYSKLVSNKPLNEVKAGYENTAPLLPKKPFSPEQMEIGSNVLGIMGDRSVAGRRLMSVEGQPLTQGVDLRGGEGFTRGEAQQSYGAGWTNEARPASALQNKINSNKDRPTYLWYLPMSEQSIDASRHISRPTLDLLKQAEPSRNAIEDYLPRLQKSIVDEKGTDIVPPLQQGQSAADYLLGLQDWSETASMKGRRALAQTLDTAKSRNSLGVDMGKIRLAATDPDLVNADTFEAGHSILRAEPGGSLIKDPALNHPDYGTQIPAEYQGRTENPFPYEDLFDEWTRAREAKKPGEAASHRAYTFRLSNPTQKVTQELIDRLMMRQEMIRRIGESGGSR